MIIKNNYSGCVYLDNYFLFPYISSYIYVAVAAEMAEKWDVL